MAEITRNTVVGAVCAEVRRIAAHPDLHRSEGAAYKAAFDRMGADALQLCADFARDCQAMGRGVESGKWVQFSHQEFMAGLGAP